MKTMKLWFANLKLKYKLMLCMAGVTTLVLLTIIVTTYENYRSMYFDAEMEKSAQAVERAASSLQRTFSSLTLKTARMLLDPTMKTVIENLEADNMGEYAASYQDVNSILENYVDSTDILVSAVLFGSSFGYGTARAGTRQSPYEIDGDDVWMREDITWLPSDYNERTQAAHVIPVLYPIASVSTVGGTLYNFGLSEHGRPVCLAVFLDERNLNEILSRFSTSMTEGFYLLSREGMVLNNHFGSMNQEVVSEINTFVMSQDELTNAPRTISGGVYYITSQPVGNGGLRIVHVFSDSSIMKSLRPMMVFLILIWIMGLIASCVLSYFIADFLTQPFRKLTEVIVQINRNAYTRKAEFRYQDEAGQLGNQINQMYDTIQRQILVIKEEEREKAQAEIQMYAEQVNPHFLYNTLECIHFQMLNDYKETACLMLGSLGKYLRLTLSHGQNVIMLAKEIEHVKEYMAIINRHSPTGRIDFDCRCEPALKTIPVLKLILQPLAENAVKHGFPRELSSYMTMPAIAIDIRQEESSLIFVITDNGQGFDPAYVSSCMKDINFEQGIHFGLRNVYKRLTAYYHEAADITFASIPYYMNTVTVRLPVQLLE